ncbi:MAG: glycine cleavage system protein GcvH [Acidimicrobiia bacterium]|nr:glycine cleavage system protein GcvH [Acidimicrobiia bacterium]
MNVPEDRRYTDQHEWALPTVGAVRIGITDYAQEALGDVVFVDVLVAPGDEVDQGQVIAEVESTKSVAEIYAPFAGIVAAVNDDLANTPEIINTDPYEAAWFLAIEPTGPLAPDSLLDAAAYEALIA